MLEPQAQGPIGSSPDTIKKTRKFRHGCTVLGGGVGGRDKGRRIPARQGKGWRQSACEM